ncbi:hypothetical protein V6B14_12720 [Sporosarcina psychrophila]|uniref:hypothetical protein n=1 Tax=Sporosarcina psychrophila TaxID=1476 RepID=UPI0030CDB2EE
MESENKVVRSCSDMSIPEMPGCFYALFDYRLTKYCGKKCVNRFQNVTYSIEFPKNENSLKALFIDFGVVFNKFKRGLKTHSDTDSRERECWLKYCGINNL